MGQGFRVIILGCCGGPREENLSSYLLYPKGKPEYAILLDGGTVLSGLKEAKRRGHLSDFPNPEGMQSHEEHVFRDWIKAYLISHPHLDHLSGLILNSQVDGQGKYIIGTCNTIDEISNHIFNGIIWPNFADEGKSAIGIYRYYRAPIQKPLSLPNLSYTLETFLLSHPKDYASSAFLLEHDGDYVLYFGDTSADSMEKQKRLYTVWNRVAPLIEAKKLRAIFLECSVPNIDSSEAIYGHLSPNLFMEEFYQLKGLCNAPLDSFKVIVTHRKESLDKGKNKPKEIELELKRLNSLGLDLIFPEQGELYDL